MPLVSPRRDTLFSHPSNTQTGIAVKAEGASGGFLPEEYGLLGHAAASSRDVPILAPGSDSRDGFCREVSQDVHGWLMQPTACEDHSSMHTMLEHSRPCILGSAATSNVHNGTDCSAAARYVPHEKCYEDSQVCD